MELSAQEVPEERDSRSNTVCFTCDCGSRSARNKNGITLVAQATRLSESLGLLAGSTSVIPFLSDIGFMASHGSPSI